MQTQQLTDECGTKAGKSGRGWRKKIGFTLMAEGFRISLHPNQTRQVVVTANVDT